MNILPASNGPRVRARRHSQFAQRARLTKRRWRSKDCFAAGASFLLFPYLIDRDELRDEKAAPELRFPGATAATACFAIRAARSSCWNTLSATLRPLSRFICQIIPLPPATDALQHQIALDGEATRQV